MNAGHSNGPCHWQSGRVLHQSGERRIMPHPTTISWPSTIQTLWNPVPMMPLPGSLGAWLGRGRGRYLSTSFVALSAGQDTSTHPTLSETAPHRQRRAAQAAFPCDDGLEPLPSSSDRSASAVRASVLAVCAEVDRPKRRRSGSVHRHGRAGLRRGRVRPLGGTTSHARFQIVSIHPIDAFLAMPGH